MDKYQPKLFVLIKSTSPILANDIVKLDHYTGNNEWIVLDTANEKHRIKEEHFHDIAKDSGKSC